MLSRQMCSTPSAPLRSCRATPWEPMSSAWPGQPVMCWLLSCCRFVFPRFQPPLGTPSLTPPPLTPLPTHLPKILKPHPSPCLLASLPPSCTGLYHTAFAAKLSCPLPQCLMLPLQLLASAEEISLQVFICSAVPQSHNTDMLELAAQGQQDAQPLSRLVCCV